MIKPVKAAAYLALVFVLAFTPLVAAKKTRTDNDFPLKPTEHERILTLWHVETFEGGVGSRGDFITGRAVEFGKKGRHVLVKTHTIESAKESLKKGEKPDLVSFGIGADFVVPMAKRVTLTVAGEKVKSRAFVWAQGGYFLFRKSGDETPIKTLTISDGGKNLPLGAANLTGVKYENIETVKSTDAYLKLISGNTDAMLGTQRDIRRFTVKNFAYTATPLEKYNDLYQYVAITTDDEDKLPTAKAFAEYLLSEKTAKKISSLYMIPRYFSLTDSPLQSYDAAKNEKTISPFISLLNLETLKEDLQNSSALKEKCYSFENSLLSPSNACN